MAESLHDKYGGFATISKVVQAFYTRVLETESVRHYFERIDMAKLLDHQTKFLCMALGGPNNYDGRGLKKAHTKLDITKGAFGEVAEILAETLEDAGVEEADVATVIAIVAGAEPDVVTRAA